tara:strand:+ start:668 stop:820 length:153 start_codon:yes stop_codon:yes gene_type:complete
MKWLDWEKDPKKESGSSEWRPILKFWICAVIIIGALLIATAFAYAPFKIS